MDFLFAALFFYALHKLAKKYRTRQRLLIPAAVASLIAFVGMVACDLTAPHEDQWLLVYAGVGLPFLIMILLLPWVNRRIIYSIPVTSDPLIVLAAAPMFKSAPGWLSDQGS